MDVNTVNSGNNAYFFNPNTGQATSNNKNSIPFDREALKAMSQKLRPVESLTGAFKSLPSSSYVDRSNNSISFAAGSTISLNGGYRLVLSAETGFQLSGELGDEKYFMEASSLRDSMNRLLKNAEKDTTLGISDNLRGEYSKWESNITKILSKYGIDTTKDFTFNGMKFTRGNDGRLISQRESDAKIAYEIQTANNRTYSLGDDRTKKEVQYKSRYYLQSVPNQVRDVWNETLDETGANPFVNKYGNTLALLAVEQDFATGGNDQLFGDSVESAIEATKKILDRIDNPLQAVPDTDKEIYETVSQRERNFYSTLLDKLEHIL